MLQAGLTLSEISRRFGARRKTIREIYANICNSGSVKDLPRSGRPPILSSRQERLVEREFERVPFVAPSEITENEASVDTRFEEFFVDTVIDAGDLIGMQF